MNCLFVNGSTEPQCGVNQMGKNIFAVLEKSSKLRWSYHEATTVGALRSVAAMPEPDVVLYNWQGGQGGILADAPFPFLNCPQALVYHDFEPSDRYQAVFFADPTMTQHGKWHVIGRALPVVANALCLPQFAHAPSSWQKPVIGVHGFLGAWADQVVHRVIQEFEYCTIALSLPFARYGDANGDQARSMADRCRQMTVNNPGITLQIGHDFLERDRLIAWLACNDLNCYFRPGDMHWRGVSSAPDFALAANRPIAVNKCNAFRHLHNLNPSICVEDSSLTEIFANGLSPLVAFKAKWCDPEKIRSDIESVLLKL